VTVGLPAVEVPAVKHVDDPPYVTGDERRTSHVPVGEIHILIPIVRSDIVPAGANVEADGRHDPPMQGRHSGGAETIGAEKPVNRRGGDGGEEPAARVGPQVVLGDRDEERTWRGKGQQLVLPPPLALPVCLGVAWTTATT
jgi:hypothetical protein